MISILRSTAGVIIGVINYHHRPVGLYELISMLYQQQSRQQGIYDRWNFSLSDPSQASVHVESFPTGQLVYQSIKLRTVANVPANLGKIQQREDITCV